MNHLRIATRGSRLALWQANYVKTMLAQAHPELSIELVPIKTKGDIILDVPLSRVGGKGLFVKEIEEALLDRRADIAVHSIKDVPMVLPESLILGCIPLRAPCEDIFLSEKFAHFTDLPRGACVGTSSLRRQSQILSKRRDLSVVSVRGNVDTRLRKLKEGAFDALILARAGVERLGLSASFCEILPTTDMIPAVGQGALGIECLEANYDVLCLLSEFEDSETRICVTAERSLLAQLDGGCQVPIAGHARLLDSETLELVGLVGEVDGSKLLTATKKGSAHDPEALGRTLANFLLDEGAQEILDRLYANAGN